MNAKSFLINNSPYNIRCLMYSKEAGMHHYGRIAICCHGFGGSKESSSIRRFAEYMLAKYKDLAILTFDWPCHGEDVRKKLTLEDCDTYLGMVIDFAKTEYGAESLYLYATSFGGYLSLKYIAEHGSPFVCEAFRCPVVNMFEILDSGVMTEQDHDLIEKGKTAMLGFETKVPVTGQLLESMRKADLFGFDYRKYAEDMMIVQGSKDELVMPAKAAEFAEKNGIDFIMVEGADHTFHNPNYMTEAILYIETLFDL